MIKINENAHHSMNFLNVITKRGDYLVGDALKQVSKL